MILSDIDGLYTADPRTDPAARLIPCVPRLTPEIEALAGCAGSALGTGGMATKLRAARLTEQAGIEMVIANGADPSVLYRIFRRRAGRHALSGRERPMKTTQELMQRAKAAAPALAAADTERKKSGAACHGGRARGRAGGNSGREPAGRRGRARRDLAGHARPAGARRRTRCGHGRGRAAGRRAARPVGRGAGADGAAERSENRKNRRPAGRRRDHLRKPPECDVRFGGALPEERERLPAALRPRGCPLGGGDRRRAARRVGAMRSSGRRARPRGGTQRAPGRGS